MGDPFCVRQHITLFGFKKVLMLANIYIGYVGVKESSRTLLQAMSQNTNLDMKTNCCLWSWSWDLDCSSDPSIVNTLRMGTVVSSLYTIVSLLLHHVHRVVARFASECSN